MTIDPETKKYIDNIIYEQSIKISSFLSALCNELEDKKILTRGEFDIIVERAQVMASNIKLMGIGNFAAFTNAVQDLEKLKNKLEKDSIEGRKNWEDLK